MTGGRIKRIREYIDSPFLLTYGDGVGDVNIKELVDFHKKNEKKVTVTVVQPSGRFGSVQFDSSDEVKVFAFQEKPKETDHGLMEDSLFVNRKYLMKLMIIKPSGSVNHWKT